MLVTVAHVFLPQKPAEPTVSILENSAQIGTNEEAFNEPPSAREIVDVISNNSSAIAGFKGVSVFPQMVRTVKLPVDKTERR